MRILRLFPIATLFLSLAAPCSAQFGGLIRKAQDKANQAKEKSDEAQKKVDKAAEAKDLATPWNETQEQQVGDASAARLVGIFGLYNNPDMVRYVNLVGHTVAARAPRAVPYRFGILDTEVITAVSLPGGYVFITRGALANMHSEAELAGTLAHEIAHVDQRHLEKEIRSKGSLQFIQANTAQFNPTQLGTLASTSLQGALTQQYSRDKETDADRIGLDLAAKAGYQPAGLRTFLNFLATAPKTPETNRQLSMWGSTHPPFSERVSSLALLEARYPPTGQVLAQRFDHFVNPAAFARQ
jgi:predicted Zn-dependent protease